MWSDKQMFIYGKSETEPYTKAVLENQRYNLRCLES